MKIGTWRVNRVVMSCLLLLCSLPCARAQEPKTVRLLTVGNSFADNALSFLPAIAESGGHKLIFAKANLGGCSLERHWRHASAYEANHNDPTGKPYAGGKKSLMDFFKQDRWDFVTIQQYSFTSYDVRTFLPYAPKLHDYIKANAPGAKILIHQTWPYRVDDRQFRASGEQKEPRSQREMYEKTRAAYRQIAEQLGIGIIPAGEAMYKADTDAQWGYKPDTTFDFAGAKAPPAVPNQKYSLHMGWSWKKDKKDNIEKLAMDGHHAGPAGQYLIGCVWYEVLFKEDVTKVGFVPKSVDAQHAAFLRQTAHEIVLEMTKTPGSREK